MTLSGIADDLTHCHVPGSCVLFVTISHQPVLLSSPPYHDRINCQQQQDNCFRFQPHVERAADFQYVKALFRFKLLRVFS